MLIKDTAICIRCVDYSETSQIVTFFARQSGKISAIAKGSKRAKSSFEGAIEIFSFGDIMFQASQGDKLSTLTEFQQKSGLSGLSRNYLGYNSSLFACELVTNLVDEYDPHPQLFDDFVQFLKDVQTVASQNETISLLIYFQLSLLREIGLQPVLSECANCKNKYNQKWFDVYFSNSANGIICRDCDMSFPDKVKLSKEVAYCLANLKNIPKANEQTLNQIERIIINLLASHMQKMPKMAKYILGK
jgi:DNA repair protein RecO (recombination protein O)